MASGKTVVTEWKVKQINDIVFDCMLDSFSGFGVVAVVLHQEKQHTDDEIKNWVIIP